MLTDPMCWDGRFNNRRSNLTQETLYLKLLNPFASESKGWKKVQYADEVIVVKKPKPRKAGNSLEDKT